MLTPNSYFQKRIQLCIGSEHSPTQNKYPETVVQNQMSSKTTLSMNEALNEAQLGSLHWRVWFLSSMGVFLDGFDLFIIGIALPLIVREFNPGPVGIGFIGAAAVLGSVLGGFLGGKFIDHYGRKSLYIVDMVFFSRLWAHVSFFLECLVADRIQIPVRYGCRR